MPKTHAVVSAASRIAAASVALTPAAASVPAPVRRGRPPKNPADSDEGNRRRQLIDAAARLFRTKGFAAASTRDIAAAAGMRSGSPFYHFASKSALLYVVMEEGMEQASKSQAHALSALTAGATPRDRLRTLVRHHFQVLLGPKADFIAVMLYEWRSLSPQQRKDIAHIKDGYEAEWVPVLQALHTSGELRADPIAARLFIFGALNWSVQWFSARGALSLEDLTTQALRLFVGES